MKLFVGENSEDQRAMKNSAVHITEQEEKSVRGERTELGSNTLEV